MAENDPPPGNPFGGGDPFAELARMFGSLGLGGLGGTGGDAWATARQIARSVATEGGTDPNLDPLVRMAVENLVRVADLHVRQVPGIRLAADLEVVPVSRSEWTDRSLDVYRPFFERFGQAIGGAGAEQVPADDPLGAMMGQIFLALGPSMVAASAGSMIGHLGQRALGQYDLPMPRPGQHVLVVPTSIDHTAEEWGVPVDELRLAVLVHELAAHSVLSTPHVQKQLERLFLDFASAFRPNVAMIEERFGGITDLGQLGTMSEELSNPELVLDLMRSPAHDLLLPQLDALVAVVLAYVDEAVQRACTPLVPSIARIREGFRSRLVDVAPADRFMERLLGIDIDDRTLERGRGFIDGIVERRGDEALERLWTDDLDLPTAAEVDAPGLWLARIGLDPDLPGGDGFEIPDDLSALDDLD